MSSVLSDATGPKAWMLSDETSNRPSFYIDRKFFDDNSNRNYHLRFSTPDEREHYRGNDLTYTVVKRAKNGRLKVSLDLREHLDDTEENARIVWEAAHERSPDLARQHNELERHLNRADVVSTNPRPLITDVSMNAKSFGLYNIVLPALNLRKKKFSSSDVGYDMLHRLAEISIFDCRALPTAFVDDTGDAAFDELKQNKEYGVRLPADNCYFEFADEPRFIYASMSDLVLGPSTLDKDHKYNRKTDSIMSAILSDPTVTYVGYQIELYDLSINAMFNGPHGVFNFVTPFHEKVGHLKLFDAVNSSKREHWDIAGRRVLAVAVLLTEQLVINNTKPDPMPRVSRERRRTQKLPISGDSHILTINVPVVRYQASRAPHQGGTHESPALHWRRGHQRIYNRGTEEEKEGWVRRCLVGDPAKGYQRPSQYRLVHRDIQIKGINTTGSEWG